MTIHVKICQIVELETVWPIAVLSSDWVKGSPVPGEAKLTDSTGHRRPMARGQMGERCTTGGCRQWRHADQSDVMRPLTV